MGATAERYTTNPGDMWPERIARKLDMSIGPNRQGGNTGLPAGFLGGTGYAHGGARISRQSGVGGTPGGGGFPIGSGARPNADQTCVFADPVHPTTGMHRVLAEDAERLLKANDLW